MGWLYSTAWPTPTAVRDMLRKDLTAGGFTILDDATTAYGRRYWALIEKPDLPATIALFLIEGGKDRYGDPEWGYKDMDESMGPYDTDCPLRLLDKAGPPPNEWAKEWRDKVRAAHTRRKTGAATVKAAKPGDRVWLTGRPDPYTVSYRYKNSLVGYRSDGKGPYRLPTKSIERHEAGAA